MATVTVTKVVGTNGTVTTTDIRFLSASDLVITKIYTLIYDGTNFQINL